MEKKQKKNEGFDKQIDLSRKNKEKTLTRREIEEALEEERYYEK